MRQAVIHVSYFLLGVQISGEEVGAIAGNNFPIYTLLVFLGRGGGGGGKGRERKANIHKATMGQYTPRRGIIFY